jgi:hypothetical protein
VLHNALADLINYKMKKLQLYSLLVLCLAALWGCKKKEFPGEYPGAVLSPYISIFDIKDLYRGTDVTLTKDNMLGCTRITATVVSDHSGGNIPAGLLVVQESRRLSQLRGISIALGAAAATYVPGDSVTITVAGGVLKKVDGILQITGVPASAVTKVSSGNTIPPNRVPSSQILADPEKFESTLSVIVKGGFNPLPLPTDVLSGDKILNDGFGDLTLHTEATATFANTPLAFNANYYGIVFNTINASKQTIPQFRLRTGNDVVVLSSSIELQPVIITGFMADLEGGDGNYEYVQLMATRDINFATTPYALVTTNNAGASTPTGAPVNGWATGGLRTYKFNLTSGTAAKGTFFYVGGTSKMINGPNSTSMTSSNWIKAYNYSNTAGEGFGTATSGLFANSGNASGVAVFEGTNITVASKPVDVLFVGTGGELYLAGTPARGYRIANTDWYDIKNPITLADQPFYRNGSNTLNLSYTLPADQGFFNKMGGEYNVTLGRWTKARTQTLVDLSKTSPVTEIEGTGSTVLK